MGWLALTCALVALICAVLPGMALFIGMGFAVAATGLGVLGYRRRADPGSTRLASAGAIGLGVIALVLTASRYGLILAALQRFEDWL